MQEIKVIPVHKIEVGEHAQRFEDEDPEIAELSESIRRLGLLEPLCVTAHGDGFMLVAGHRRMEACRRIGMEDVQCLVAVGDEATMREITFAENFFSKDLTPVELAAAIATEVKEERMTVDQLAAGFRKTTDWVRRQIAVVGWPEDVLEGIHTGKLSIAAASNLACITEDFYRKSLVQKAVDNGATARTTSSWLQGWKEMYPVEYIGILTKEEEQERQQPAVPQGPCLACHDVFRMDELSHVPLCANCIKVISTAGQVINH